MSEADAVEAITASAEANPGKMMTWKWRASGIEQMTSISSEEWLSASTPWRHSFVEALIRNGMAA